MQEAFASPLERWPRDGVPDEPRRLDLTTARNRAIDRLRREAQRPASSSGSPSSTAGARRTTT